MVNIFPFWALMNGFVKNTSAVYVCDTVSVKDWWDFGCSIWKASSGASASKAIVDREHEVRQVHEVDEANEVQQVDQVAQAHLGMQWMKSLSWGWV